MCVCPSINAPMRLCGHRVPPTQLCPRPALNVADQSSQVRRRVRVEAERGLAGVRRGHRACAGDCVEFREDNLRDCRRTDLLGFRHPSPRGKVCVLRAPAGLLCMACRGGSMGHPHVCSLRVWLMCSPPARPHASCITELQGVTKVIHRQVFDQVDS